MDREEFLGVSPSSLESILKAGLSYIPMVMPITETLIDRVSYRNLQSPVQNQGGGEYCVPFAVAACGEYLIRNGIGGSPPVGNIKLSEAHISHAAEKRHGNCSPGMPLWHAAEAMAYWGVVTADVWPYDPNVYCSPTPPDRSTSLWYRTPSWNLFSFRDHDDVVDSLLRYARGSDLKIMHSADFARKDLANGKGAVLIDIPVVYGSGWDEPTDGTVQMPSAESIRRFLEEDIVSPPGTRGWHAIVLTGFDDSTKRFEFKNSWGAWWGNGGYGTIPYDYVSLFNREMWSSVGIRYEVRTGPLPGAY